tara:strand:+ start:5155 stop:5925 length:771 start_codon:yes stop_codon:yes gene_type:complete
MDHVNEYDESMLAAMDLIWGEGFMAPGGEGNVDLLVKGLDLAGKKVLDIGCGQGRPACILAQKYGAHVTGTDLEAHLIKRSIARAEKMSLSQQIEFIQVKPGPLTFPDNSFDFVISSGAFTQIDDKIAMYRECLRVLKPGGVLSCYDWMKTEGDYSDDMLYWFKAEGLTYAMRTPQQHLTLLQQAGFSNPEIDDRSRWYRHNAHREYELIKSELYNDIVDLIGIAEADDFVENWRALTIVCEKKEMLQVYTRAYAG